MAIQEPNSAVVGISFAGLFSAVPFGVPVETIAIGTGFFSLGIFARAAFEMQKTIERGDHVGIGQVLGWVGAGLIGAPFGTILYVVFLHTLKVQSNDASILGLLVLGFGGPRLLTALMGAIVGLWNKVFGGEVHVPNPADGKGDFRDQR